MAPSPSPRSGRGEGSRLAQRLVVRAFLSGLHSSNWPGWQWKTVHRRSRVLRSSRPNFPSGRTNLYARATEKPASFASR
jgi:hypothetical protein